jgi:hypothetical protein
MSDLQFTILAELSYPQIIFSYSSNYLQQDTSCWLFQLYKEPYSPPLRLEVPLRTPWFSKNNLVSFSNSGLYSSLRPVGPLCYLYCTWLSTRLYDCIYDNCRSSKPLPSIKHPLQREREPKFPYCTRNGVLGT